jgi:hypothetical protein
MDTLARAKLFAILRTRLRMLLRKTIPFRAGVGRRGDTEDQGSV